MYYDTTINQPVWDTGAATGLATLGIIALFFFIIGLGLGVLLIISMWKIFTKAGKPGWAAIVPIYNFIILLEVCKLPIWLILAIFLFWIPVIGWLLWMGLMVAIGIQLARAFNKEDVFAVGIVLLPIVFYPILAFGKDTYSEPKELF